MKPITIAILSLLAVASLSSCVLYALYKVNEQTRPHYNTPKTDK